CVYKIGNHYYITNSEKISAEDYSSIIKNASSSSTGKVFIDDWKASLNGTLQNYKEDVMTCVLGKFSILKLKIEIIVLL
ncbi:MAG: hypothetical protein ACTTKH_08570, partial [Treponema sp.]